MNTPKAPPAILQTPGFAHYSLAWSPFHATRLAVASSANFGLVGNGRLHLILVSPGPTGIPALTPHKKYETQDGLYDIAWSEGHENQLVTGSGDGSIRLWDIMLNDSAIRAWHEHTREVFSVDWSNIQKDTFASSSWDGNVKLWTPDRPRSVSTLNAHHSCVYQALFSPHQPDILASCSADGTLKIFDLRSPAYAAPGPKTNNFTHPISAAALTVPASGTEVLTLDWNKYRPFVLASAGVDKIIKIWDCRMIKAGEVGQVGGACENQLLGHEYAVRKVQWSPHSGDVLASASYDMTCRVWNTAPVAGNAPLMYIHDPHTEFVVGCGWSLHEEALHEMNDRSQSILRLHLICLCDVCFGTMEELEDIFSSSLEALYDYQPITLASAGLEYKRTFHHRRIGSAKSPNIALLTPNTLPANWSLHASDIWASSIYLADHIDQVGLEAFISRACDQTPTVVRVLELGAAAGLPGILIAKLYEGAASVIVSDYPDEQLIKTLSDNVARNGVSRSCCAVAHAWGSDPSCLLRGHVGFDVIIAADTLWNPDLHRSFVATLRETLKKSAAARVHLVAGLHTGRYTIQSFMTAVGDAGFEVETALEKEVAGLGERSWSLERAEREDEKERRRWAVWIVLRWNIHELESDQIIRTRR